MTTKFWHPYALEYPMMDGPEWTVFKRRCKDGSTREPVLYRLLDGGKQYLDGRNRCRAADELGIEWPEKEVVVADDEVRDFIDDKNLHRRQLKKKERDRIVCLLHSKGFPATSIASKLGTSPRTVGRITRGKRPPKNTAKTRPKSANADSSGKNPGKTTSGLIPELSGVAISPKIQPQIEKWSRSKQLDFLSHMHETGGNVGKALHMTENQREAGEENGAAVGSRVHAKIPKWPQLDKLIKSVEALPDTIADCYQGVEKNCEEYHDCQAALANFRRAWDRWQGRLTFIPTGG